MAELIQKIIKPQVYAYTTKQYKDTAWVGQKEGKGLLKVGYTEKDVEKRIWEQFPTKTPESCPFEILLVEEAIDEQGNFFTDHQIHKILTQKGFKRVNGEWFECTLADLRNSILELKKGVKISQSRHLDFNPRPEQEKAVELTAEYFKKYPKSKDGSSPHFLWNAKMRFGKTFTAYQLAKKMGWNRIMVLTYKPAVADAWKDDIESHIDFEGWKFFDRENIFDTKDLYSNKPFVWFASFQDILGRTKDNEIKDRLKLAHEIEWDCIILDEYHFGAWRDSARDLYDKETAQEMDIDEKIEEEYSEDLLKNRGLNSDHFLYLSGTPFRAVATGEFLENQIFNWTYADEQRAKKGWDISDGPNPYEELPQIVMLTYQLPEKVREIATTTDQNEFDLNEFFKARKEVRIDGPHYVFEHENEVQKWLNIIRGQESIFGGLTNQGDKSPILPFEDVNLLSYLNHTFWFLPRIDSCKAMAELLGKANNTFYHDYEVIVAAGADAGIGLAALAPLRNKIGTGRKTKTITLSCGKLTTGVTIPQWSGIFFLRNTTSPETYFQAGFRVQSPWFLRNSDGLDPKKKEILKPRCYIFDFAPNRALNLISEYSERLDLNDVGTPEHRVQEFLNFLPVLCFDGTAMQELKAGELLDYAAAGVTSTMLARRWQSAQLVDISTFALERLLNSPDLIEALQKIEAFRKMNLGDELSRVITSEKDINKLKAEKADRDLTASEEKELDQKEKEKKSFKKELREKLLKFVSRIPVFMYLTDYREETLKHVITNIEPELFTKVTGLSVKDFDKICEIGVFNKDKINYAIFGFRRLEEPSLNYLGGKVFNDSDIIGGFDKTIHRSEMDGPLVEADHEILKKPEPIPAQLQAESPKTPFDMDKIISNIKNNMSTRNK